MGAQSWETHALRKWMPAKREKREWKLRTCPTEQVQTDNMSDDQNISCTFSWALPCALPWALVSTWHMGWSIGGSNFDVTCSHLVLIRLRNSPERKMINRAESTTPESLHCDRRTALQRGLRSLVSLETASSTQRILLSHTELVWYYCWDV